MLLVDKISAILLCCSVLAFADTKVFGLAEIHEFVWMTDGDGHFVSNSALLNENSVIRGFLDSAYYVFRWHKVWIKKSNDNALARLPMLLINILE